MWQSFHFDENAETIDACVRKIGHMAAMLNYSEPQILEVFKMTLVSHLYQAVFQIDNLRQALETVKRTLTKEKVDRQLAGQSTGASNF